MLQAGNSSLMTSNNSANRSLEAYYSAVQTLERGHATRPRDGELHCLLGARDWAFRYLHNHGGLTVSRDICSEAYTRISFVHDSQKISRACAMANGG